MSRLRTGRRRFEELIDVVSNAVRWSAAATADVMRCPFRRWWRTKETKKGVVKACLPLTREFFRFFRFVVSVFSSASRWNWTAGDQVSRNLGAPCFALLRIIPS